MSLLILVVDDEPDVEVLFRQQFRRDLRSDRLTMEFAQSAPMALQRITDAAGVSLILILSDINMPGMSGLELLPKAKALRPDVPVIMITAYGETGGDASGRAAKAATATIPIVFTSSGDPVREGLIASFNRPGGNATGVNLLLTAIEGKRLELLREMVPTAALIAVLLNPANAAVGGQVNDVQAAARSAGQQLHILRASNDGEIDAAFAAAAELRVGALLVASDPFFNSRRERLAELASRYAIPAIYELREYAAAGGLMSYGINLAEAYRLLGVYTGRILKGDKPAELPVQQLTKFEFIINLKAAKALGIEVPPGLLARADEVIE